MMDTLVARDLRLAELFAIRTSNGSKRVSLESTSEINCASSSCPYIRSVEQAIGLQIPHSRVAVRNIRCLLRPVLARTAFFIFVLPLHIVFPRRQWLSRKHRPSLSG